MMHRLETMNSFWDVDLDSKILIRLPKGGEVSYLPPAVPYEKVGAPRSFVSYERFDYPDGFTYKFTFDTGYWAETGSIIQGELPDAAQPERDEANDPQASGQEAG